MEKAFIVKPESKLYKDYFASKAEREKFKNLGNAFFDKIGYDGTYTLSERLCVTDDNIDVQEFFKGELCKNPDKYGLYKFKAKSTTQKRWEQEVVSQIDMKVYNATRLWYFGCIYSGSYSLWDYNGNLYGYFHSKYDNIKLTDDMEEIKMSEYYKVIEDSKDEENQGLAD